jgi:2-polyprenyl-6-methoxyphenol hydroxylase-like FAD-dependent oxidoreductase
MSYGRELQKRHEQAQPDALQAAAHRQAVVVGGSIGGMVAARVLSDHFDRVVIVERDHFPVGDENRPGVPHARHLHLLLKRGLMIIEELFPGVKSDLLAAGGHVTDQGKDFRMLYRWGWSPTEPIGVEVCTFTRPLLESTMRRHLMDLPNVEVLEGYEAAGLEGDSSGARVTGLRIQPRNRADGVEVRTLRADLVVDTSGRPSEAPEWLKELGFEAPEETVIDAFWGYATRIYEMPENFQADWKVMGILNRPPYQPRAGIIEPIEGNRWLVSVAGVMRDYPPTDEEGFLAFARSLSSPEIYNAISVAKPLSGIRGFRRTANRLRHFEKLSRLPEGFVALGDSVCAFNPVYGQGMTLTCLQAMELGRCLRENDGRVDGHTFHQRVAKLVAAPWALATGEDLRWPATQGGEINARVKFMHWYIDHVIHLMTQDADVYRRFQLVNHMLAGPETLFHPAILGKVLRQSMVPMWAKTALAALAGRREKKAVPAVSSQTTQTATMHTRAR